jgi:hypothetical protein
MSVDGSPAQGLAPGATEAHQRIDRARMKPMGAEIDRVAFEAPRERAPTDAVARLQDRDRQPMGEEMPITSGSVAGVVDDSVFNGTGSPTPRFAAASFISKLRTAYQAWP